jgi:hypothetical protein
MANPLTGDFAAVLQVSGSTINRLLASMHQNSFENPKLPSFPHTIRIRIGDDYAYDGIRGLVHAQAAPPRVQLIHGATDRFLLSVAVRAWYRPDPGTQPMPAFVHGTVHAEYRMRDIGRSCLGWSTKTSDYLWFRVVRDSVRFAGTVEDDSSAVETVEVGSGDSASAAAANIGKITRQIARLLAKRFAPMPQPVSKRFRHGTLRSLNTPIGGSVIALPLAINGEPAGDIDSIDNVLSAGHDVAVAVNVNHILSLVDHELATIKNFSKSVPVDEYGISTVYQVGVHPPSVQWLAQGSNAVFKVNINGWANTNSVLANATFSIEQDVILYFSGKLLLSPGSLSVTAHASGLGHGKVASKVKEAVLAEVPPIVQAICNNAQLSLDTLSQTEELLAELKKLDDQAALWLDSAEFVTSGLVIRGTIAVAPRRHVVIRQEKTADGDAHSALESWIPGGRIDRFEWSWTWAGSGESGAATYSDRFLLRRPRGRLGRWGMVVGLTTPLPGLDGWGSVCLRITGAQVDPVTGEFVTIITERRCSRFGFHIAVAVEGGRLFLRDMPELSQDVPFPQLNDRPLVAASRQRRERDTVNTFVLYVDETRDGDVAATFAEALQACRRYDAGLAALVLFREGGLDNRAFPLLDEMRGIAGRLGVAVHINEDVDGGWVRAFQWRAGTGEPGLAIITPDGKIAWTHQGRIDATSLTAVLDANLDRCPDLTIRADRPLVEVGARVGLTALYPDIAALEEEPHCPPFPFARLADSDTVLTFIQRRSTASVLHLRRLAADHARAGPERASAVLVVVDGADQREVGSLTNELGLDFPFLGDPAGGISDRLGIDIWPTTIKIDRSGIVSDIQAGMWLRSGQSSGQEESVSGVKSRL